ncbi:carbohydrate ABC transporter permease [Plantactinospora mayteni]|nr:sugar ABC transporter permease [Plantactinospora mayteni]
MTVGRTSGGSRWVPYAFLLPGIALFSVFFAWPAMMAIRLSFYEYNVVSPARFVGLDNFRRLLTDDRFHLALGNSALYLVGMIPFAVIIPIWLAVLVNQKVRGIRAFRAMYYLPAITSMVAVGVAWRYLFHQQGVLNWALIETGIIDKPIQYLLSDDWALPALVLVEGWKMVGFFMMIYLAGLQSIPAEIFEAAKVDGANSARRMWHVTIPLLLPYTTVTLTLGMLDALRVFESVYVMTRGGPQDSTISLGYLAWSTAFERYQLGYASAIGLVMLVLMVGLAVLNQRITRER